MRIVNDRRRSSRVIARGEAVLHTSRGPIPCRCVDIGTSGISVDIDSSARFRKRMKIAWSFVGRVLEFDAVVARRRRVGAGFRLGLRFDPRGSQGSTTLAELVRVLQTHAVLTRQARVFLEQLPRLEVPRSRTQEALAMPRTATPRAEIPAAATVPTPPKGGTLRPAVNPGAAVPYGLAEGWHDEELDTQQFRDPSLEAPRIAAPEVRRTLIGVPTAPWQSLGKARSGDTVLSEAPLPPARTGVTVVVHRSELVPEAVADRDASRWKP